MTTARAIEVKAAGTIKLHNIKFVSHEAGHLVAVSRSGEIAVLDEAAAVAAEESVANGWPLFDADE